MSTAADLRLSYFNVLVDALLENIDHNIIVTGYTKSIFYIKVANV